jgi:hypothetical protein
MCGSDWPYSLLNGASTAFGASRRERFSQQRPRPPNGYLAGTLVHLYRINGPFEAS